MFSKLNYAEPSVLRGILTALLALATSVGFVVPSDLSEGAKTLIPVVAFLVPLVQSLWTRAAVVSPKTLDQATGRHEAAGV